MALSNSAKKEILKQQARASFPYLIEISNETELYRYCNSDEDILFEGNLYESCYFTIQPPEKSDDKIGDGKLSLSIIDTVWIKRIRETQSRYNLHFVAIIDYKDDSNQRTFEKIENLNFILTSADWEDTVITWTMKFDEDMDIMMPIDKMTELVCPAIV